MGNPLPQPVLAPLTPAAIFLVARIADGGEERVRDALPGLSGLVRAIGFRDPAKHLSLVTSIGSDAWDRLFAGPRPAELHPFPELRGARHHAPATPGDLLFHIRAETLDVCFELAGRLLKAMAGAITVVDEVHGFRFFDNRDLLGFVDGTENPDGPPAVVATEVGDEDPDFAGGCYVMCRSTCTTWTPGMRCRSASRSGSSAAQSLRTSNSPMMSSPPIPMWP